MTKQMNNQYGIALVVEVILGALLVTLLGAGGYVALHHTQPKQVASGQTSKSTSSTASTSSAQKTPEATKKEPVQLPAEAAPSCSYDQLVYVTAADGLNLRSSKSTSAAKVIAIPYTSALQVGCSDGTWYTASYAGKAGYVQIQYTSPTKPSNDSDLITAAIKSQDATVQAVNNIVISGSFAKASVQEEMGGYAAILQKINGTWTVIFTGQQPPSNAFGTSHGLPSGWYATAY